MRTNPSSMRLTVFLALASLVAAGGCVEVRVRKVTNNSSAPGQRISLAKPFIYAEPLAEGRVSVSEVYYPDPHNQYAVEASTRMADYTLKITRTNGIVTQVMFNQDTTGTASKALETGAAVGTKIIEEQQKQAEADRKERETLLADIDKAAADVLKLDDELQLLQIEVSASPNDATKKAKRDAKQRDRDFALNDLNVLRRRAGLDAVTLEEVRAGHGGRRNRGASGGGTALAAKATSQPATRPSEWRRLWGPILYAVNERLDGDRPVITLDPVTFDGKPQREFWTVDNSPTGGGAQLPAKRTLGMSRAPHATLGQVILVQHPAGKQLTQSDINTMRFFKKVEDGEVSDPVTDEAKLSALRGNVSVETGGGLRIVPAALEAEGIKGIEVDGVPGVVPKQ